MTRQQIKVTRVDGWDDDWFAVITDPVVVRFNQEHRKPWRCSRCGRHPEPTCDHEKAAHKAAEGTDLQ